MLAIVVPLGSIVLFSGVTEITAFNNSMSNTIEHRNNGIQEDLIFEHIRFDPNSKQVTISAFNTGSVDITIDRITLVNMTSQNILFKMDSVSSFVPVVLTVQNSTDIDIVADFPQDDWSDNKTPTNWEYRISIITSRGNFFDTIARPFKHLKKLIFRKRRAVSETIGTLLLLVVTVAGAVVLSNFISDGFFGVDQNRSTVEASSDSIHLTGFDTRDSSELINIASLNNKFDKFLCAKGNNPNCTIVTPDDIPSDDGTEFIAIQIRNMNSETVTLQNIQVNNELHRWDAGTAGILFDASLSADAGTRYPRAGFFSILPSSDRVEPDEQFSNQEILSGEEVRVIIKLSEDLSDIKMWDSVQIVVNFGGAYPADFIVSSGDAKW